MFAKYRIMLMSIGILTSSAFAFQNTNTDSSDTLYQLVTLAENVLFGKNLESALSFLASGSTVVSSSRIADLHSVLAGKDSSIRVVEDSTRRSMEVRLKTNAEENCAFLVLTTATALHKDLRYHTFIFEKDSTHRWRLEVWRTAD